VRKERKKAKEKKKKAGRGCRAEFDYAGWGKYNGWRREVRAKYYSKKGMGNGDEGKGKNCWRDCDFPSECHNEAKAERQWEAYRERMRVLEEKYIADKEMEEEKEDEGVRSECLPGVQGVNTDTDLFVFGDGDRDQEMDDIESESDSASLFLEDDTDMEEIEPKETKANGKEKEKEGLRLGPIGTDCDGLGESNIQLSYTSSRRRKSVDATIESPPNSPLKTCNFGFEDKEMGCDVWAERGTRDLEIDEDEQMQEALRARSDFLGRCERGDEEEFGDEMPVF
jgi:hypothetical protein